MAENEVNDGSDEIRISDRTERTSKHTAYEAVSDSERAQGYEQRFTTFSDNDEDQSFKAIQPAVDSFGIDFGDGTVETAKGKIATSELPQEVRPRPYGLSEAAQAADSKSVETWNPSSGLLNILDPSSWTKLQQYAGDVGRANGWEGTNGGDQWIKINALRHALATGYISYNYGSLAAVSAGHFHEFETSVNEIFQGIPWSNKPEDQRTWHDHFPDIHNNLAGAKIAQQIRDRGGSWKEVEQAIVQAVSNLGGDKNRIPHPDVRLRTFLR